MLKWENEMLNKADVITSCSELLKDMVLKQYKINKNIIVIPNPYNEIDFTSSSENKNLNLIYAVKITLYNSLNLIGVIPKERM